MNTILIIFAFACTIVGLVGAIVPGLPGPPMSWVGLLLARLSNVAIGTEILIIAAIVAIVITIIDYIMPSLSTKKKGGTKWGTWGCNIGLIISIVGLPFGPQGLLGVIVWPFVGAFVGEYLKQHQSSKALKAASGAFVGFLGGTLLKTVYAIVAVIILVAKVF